jgi:hypothetical protein
MTLWESPQLEITVEDLSKSIIVSQGGQSINSQNSGSSVRSQSQNQSQPASPRGGTTQSNMVGVDNTPILPQCQGVGSADLEQHIFVSETIRATKNIQDNAMKISQLATTFRGHALLWYMKL